MHQEALWHWETTFNFTPSPHAHRPHATPELSLKRNSHRKNLSRPWGLAACDVSGSVVGFFDRGFQRKKQSSSSKKQHEKVLFSFFFFSGWVLRVAVLHLFLLIAVFSRSRRTAKAQSMRRPRYRGHHGARDTHGWDRTGGKAIKCTRQQPLSSFSHWTWQCTSLRIPHPGGSTRARRVARPAGGSGADCKPLGR